MKQQVINQLIIKAKTEKKMSQINKERKKNASRIIKIKINQIKVYKEINKLKELIISYKIYFLQKNIIIQNKQTVYTQDQVSNKKDQGTLLNQSLSLMHPLHQFNYT
ncbi:hypothetical protein TTHERM_000255715 (macronuclear) [Tetrahymena thermophila SB210]|uniref:Uncharacterized protein n=1 Tax=Tetrahymena thermophila (strain SB210) TaxID=312017 RepID=W7XB24_TETTS|nr:hypothetical protein TTHERM_000255715 [Tetrahymena thermophila SB210]EWS73628.1 hypothetical protein TTHERM_000255715 [Tetrahymena thermophila SB210]|eukprot:XP_012653858.1 hypothetical protein TTHERM_000255715 [Tetrahymena thermophila SB210]